MDNEYTHGPYIVLRETPDGRVSVELVHEPKDAHHENVSVLRLDELLDAYNSINGTNF